MVNLLDPELPFLASQAAVELDLILNGAESKTSAIQQLADRLKSTLTDVGGAPTQKSLSSADTATVAVLGQAWNQSSSQNLVEEISDLGNKTAEIADKLSMVTPGGKDHALEWMRAYCIALSRSAAAYRKSIFDIQRPHPFRR